MQGISLVALYLQWPEPHNYWSHKYARRQHWIDFPGRNSEFHQLTKHIEIRERFITSLVDRKIVVVFYIPTRCLAYWP